VFFAQCSAFFALPDYFSHVSEFNDLVIRIKAERGVEGSGCHPEIGGSEGSRTPVRNCVKKDISGCSLRLGIPLPARSQAVLPVR